MDVAAAMERNLEGHVAFIQRHAGGMQVIDGPDLLVVDSGLGCDTFNKVLRARLEPRAVERRVAEAIGYFRERHRPFAWWLGPLSRPLDLGRRLERHGLERAESERGMVVELATLPVRVEVPEGLTIRRALAATELEDFAAVNAANWDPPDAAVLEFYRRGLPVLRDDDCPMRMFVGYAGGSAVAAGELFLGGGVAGLYGISTREAWRGRGIGRAMVWALLAEARRLGVRTATLQASGDGRRVYEKLGFIPSGEFVEYQ